MNTNQIIDSVVQLTFCYAAQNWRGGIARLRFKKTKAVYKIMDCYKRYKLRSYIVKLAKSFQNAKQSRDFGKPNFWGVALFNVSFFLHFQFLSFSLTLVSFFAYSASDWVYAWTYEIDVHNLESSYVFCFTGINRRPIPMIGVISTLILGTTSCTLYNI